jgi:RimJ/RimL family protein N-acetyltransferase
MLEHKKLIGKFINLRLLQIDDASVTFNWRASQRASLLNAGAKTVTDQKEWIKGRPKNEYNFIIELKNNLPVGMLSLININHINKNAETARFLIGDENSVKGLPVAVEAMKLIYEFAFEDLNLARLYGTVASENSLMVKWQKYLGMKEEGRMRNHFFINGNWQDAIILGLLVDEYQTQSLPRMNALISVSSRNPVSVNQG